MNASSNPPLEATPDGAALQISEARYRRLFETAQDGILILDATTGQVVDANPFMQVLLGYSLEEFVGKKLWEIGPFKGIEACKTAFAELQVKDSVRYESLSLERKDSGRVEAEFVSNAYVAAQRRLIQCNIRDITARNRAVEELRLSEARYRRLFETAQDGILILDATTGQVVDANPFMQVLLGYSLEEFVGKKLWEIGPFKGIEACKTAFAELQVKDSVRYESLPLERKSGGRVEAEFISNAYIAAQRRLIQCNIRDVTERIKLAEHSLRTQRLESIGMLAAGISHDLNNVLAPIGMVVSLLRTSITDPKDLRMLDILDRSADRGAGLVRQIIGFVHGVGGEPRVVQVKHLLNDVSEIIRETFPKSIIVEVQLVPDLWPVLANPTQIHQVLLNLSVNARDAMSAGGTLRLSAENCVLDAAAAQAIKGAAPGAWLMLQVEDTGTGIPPELLERIWEPFFTTKAAGEGTGLGLSTVRGIISASHGFMTLQTAMGRGTTVRAYLPVAPADAAGDSSSNPFPQESGNDELVLIVDDEQFIRDMAGATLDHAGYRTVMATNGEEALAIFNEKSAEISLIITDLDMPRMGGVALARAIRVINPALKILAMGGIADRYTKEKPCDFASAFIAKPFTVAILVNQVQRLLHGVGSKPPIPLALPVGAGSPPAIAVTS